MAECNPEDTPEEEVEEPIDDSTFPATFEIPDIPGVAIVTPGSQSATDLVDEMLADDDTDDEIVDLVEDKPELNDMPGELVLNTKPAICCTLISNDNGTPMVSSEMPAERDTVTNAVEDVTNFISTVQEALNDDNTPDEIAAEVAPITPEVLNTAMDVYAEAAVENPDDTFSPSQVGTSLDAIITVAEDVMEAEEAAIDVAIVLNEETPGSITVRDPTGPGPIGPIFTDIITPHRVYTKNFNKVPVSAGTIATLQDNMRDRLDDFKTALDKMNVLGLDVDLTQAIKFLENKIDRLQDNGAKRHLRKIRRAITKMMKHINAIAARKGLFENEDFVEQYNIASDNLFRRNSRISVFCYALWAQAKLVLRRTLFERRVLNREGMPKRFYKHLPQEKADRMIELIGLMKTGETEEAQNHLADQTAQVVEYHELCRENFRHLFKVQRAAAKAGEESDCKAFQFRRTYCSSMKEWKRFLHLASI
jgi:hypothetical protein